MFGTGFLGTRGDFMMDFIVVALIVIVPLMILAWRWARQKRFKAHRNLMVVLTVVLTVAVSLFEMDMKEMGGFFVMAEESSFHGSAALDVSFWVHMALVSITSTVWLLLVPVSVWKFGNPPRPGGFSKFHRPLGVIGFVGMLLSAATSVEMYVLAFVY